MFNPAGQRIELAGLPCLFDAEGPCANALKDAQRTKPSDATRLTLSLLWCSQKLAARCDAAYDAYRALLVGAGAHVEPVHVIEAPHSAEP